MRVAVMGAGGIGGYYGGMLARAGEDVVFVARGTHLEAMRNRGLTVKTTHVGEFTLPVQAISDPGEIGPVDLVLFCVKGYDTDAADALITPLVGPQTVILSLQNGVENEERIGHLVGHDHVIGGTTQVASKLESPGIINQTWVEMMYMGELDGQPRPRSERLLETFQRAEVAAQIPPHIGVAMWCKLVDVGAFASICCVTRLPAGEMLSCPETSELYYSLVEEGIAVARATGLDMPEDFVGELRGMNADLAPTVRASMYYDLEAGRRLELEDLAGTIVRVGRQQGVPTPLNFAMYAALKPYINGGRSAPLDTQ